MLSTPSNHMLFVSFVNEIVTVTCELADVHIKNSFECLFSVTYSALVYVLLANLNKNCATGNIIKSNL